MWPVSGAPTGCPVAASHCRTVLSKPPDARRVPSGLNATLDTSDPVSTTLIRLTPLTNALTQWAVIRGQSSCCKQLLRSARTGAAGTATGQHRLGLGHQPPSLCLVTLLHGLLSLLNRFLSLHDRDHCGGDRNDGQHGQPRDRRTP